MIKKSLAIAMISLAVLLPFVYDFAMAGRLDNVVITDSIPDNHVLIWSILTLYSIVTIALGHNLMTEHKIIGGVWLVSLFWLVYYSNDYYNTMYEQYLFRHPGILQTKTLRITDVEEYYTRSGSHYRAELANLDGTKRRPKIKVDRDVFDAWKSFISTHTSPDIVYFHPYCLVKLTVESNGSHQRVTVYNGKINRSAIVSCSS